MPHIPVLLHEVIEILHPEHGAFAIDGTFGGGGHARAIGECIAPHGIFLGIDRDHERIAAGTPTKEYLETLHVKTILACANYTRIQDLLSEHHLPKPDCVLLDLGFASFHVDEAERGFSFQEDGPLDMRYDRRDGITAAEVVNSFTVAALAEIFRGYGEERAAFPIAERIVAARKEKRIMRTTDLAALVESVKGPRRGAKINPATKVFQALRMYVNDEFHAVKEFLETIPDILAPQGRVAIISFHGLEDLAVKTAFRELAHSGKARLMTKKAVQAKRAEVLLNPRARSAKLRAIQLL